MSKFQIPNGSELYEALYYRLDFLLDFIPSVRIRKDLYSLLKNNFYNGEYFKFKIDHNKITKSLFFVDPDKMKDKYALAINFLDIIYPFLEESERLKIEKDINLVLDSAFQGMSWEYGPYLKDKIYRSKIPKKTFIWEGPYLDSHFKLNESSTVFDVGAHLGLFTIFAAHIVGEKGKVYAFEPIKRYSDIIEKNVKLNQLLNVEIVPIALGDRDGFASIDGLTVTDNHGNIKLSTMDSFIEEYGIGNINFIKMDVEGYERKVIENGLLSLRKFKPNLSICIYHLKDDPQVLKDLIMDIDPNYKVRTNETGKKYFAQI